MPGVKAILPTLRRRLSTGDIFKPARKLVRLFLHIRKDFITRVASKNVWVILAPSNGLIAIMNWFQKVSLNEMSGKVLTSPPQIDQTKYYLEAAASLLIILSNNSLNCVDEVPCVYGRYTMSTPTVLNCRSYSFHLSVPFQSLPTNIASNL